MEFLQKVLDFIAKFGGLGTMGQVSGVLMLLIASMKVSFIKPLWDKLGAYQALVAPMLSLVAGLVMVQPFSLEAAVAFLLTGLGAVAFHELLDVVKAMPWVGPAYKKLIEIFMALLGGNK